MRRRAPWIAGVLGVAAVPMVGWAQDRGCEWGWGMMDPMSWMWGAWGIGMMVITLAFWAVVIVGIVLGIRWLVGQGKESRSDAALEILRQRYARGEVLKEEFEAKTRDLS